MKNVFTIGELARLYGVGTDSIRYYEEQGLISPQRAPNGYRIYNIRDIWRMNVIRDLRGLGFPLERIRAYLGNRSVGTTLQLLEEERQAIDGQIAALTAQRDNVDARIRTLRQAGQSAVGVVEEATLPPRRCHQIEAAFSTDEEVDVLIKQLLNRDKRRLYLIGSRNIGCRIPREQIEQQHWRGYSGVFLIDEAGEVGIPGGRYLRLRYTGNTLQNKVYIPQLLAYAEAHGLRQAGDVLELLWIDIHEAQDEKEHMTELQMMVEPRA